MRARACVCGAQPLDDGRRRSNPRVGHFLIVRVRVRARVRFARSYTRASEHRTIGLGAFLHSDTTTTMANNNYFASEEPKSGRARARAQTHEHIPLRSHALILPKAGPVTSARAAPRIGSLARPRLARVDRRERDGRRAQSRSSEPLSSELGALVWWALRLATRRAQVARRVLRVSVCGRARAR